MRPGAFTEGDRDYMLGPAGIRAFDLAPLMDLSSRHEILQAAEAFDVDGSDRLQVRDIGQLRDAMSSGFSQRRIE